MPRLVKAKTWVEVLFARDENSMWTPDSELFRHATSLVTTGNFEHVTDVFQFLALQEQPPRFAPWGGEPRQMALGDALHVCVHEQFADKSQVLSCITFIVAPMKERRKVKGHVQFLTAGAQHPDVVLVQLEIPFAKSFDPRCNPLR